MNFLSGYKTYILGFAALITIGLTLFGVISPEIANTLLPLFGFGSIITLRSAISNT